MDFSLNSSGLFVDNLHALRIIDPQVSQDTTDLKDESRFYSGSELRVFGPSFLLMAYFVIPTELDDFRQLIQQILDRTLKFNAEVDRQKMITIGAENKARARKQEMERQELQSQIQEKRNKLEEMNTRYQMLLRVAAQQREIIDNFYQTQ